MNTFSLPPVISELVVARNRLKDHYRGVGLSFTFDGNLIGDIGETVASELFGLKLWPKNRMGIDGEASDGRTVQVKATGTGRGPAFRMVEKRADHLIFLDFDLDNLKGEIVYNGPETTALSFLPEFWTGQRSLTPRQIRKANALVSEDQRLRRIIAF